MNCHFVIFLTLLAGVAAICLALWLLTSGVIAIVNRWGDKGGTAAFIVLVVAMIAAFAWMVPCK